MVHVHGRRVQQLVEPLRRIPPEQVIAVAVDAGKVSAVALVADFTGERLCPAVFVHVEPVGDRRAGRPCRVGDQGPTGGPGPCRR